MKGQEERDTLFARLFGITSLAQSGLLFRSTPLSNSSNPQCTLKDFQEAMEMLLALPSRKSFLKEPAYWTLILALKGLAKSEVAWKDEAWNWIVGKVFEEDKGWSPEKIGVAITLQTLGVEKDWKALLAPTFKNGDVLASSSLNTLAKILRVSPFPFLCGHFIDKDLAGRRSRRTRPICTQNQKCRTLETPTPFRMGAHPRYLLPS